MAEGLTQAGLALRADVSLATLRKFEQTGVISLQSFLKLLAVLDGLQEMVNALEKAPKVFNSIEDVLNNKPAKPRKRGHRT